LLKLGKHAVDGCKSGVGAAIDQALVDVLSGEMANGAFLKQL
jgi:hypothetical protein